MIPAREFAHLLISMCNMACFGGLGDTEHRNLCDAISKAVEARDADATVEEIRARHNAELLERLRQEDDE